MSTADDSMKKVSEDLENAQGEVARLGQEVADVAIHITHNGERGYFVPYEDMKELKAACKTWKVAGANLMMAIAEAAKKEG